MSMIKKRVPQIVALLLASSLVGLPVFMFSGAAAAKTGGVTVQVDNGKPKKKPKKQRRERDQAGNKGSGRGSKAGGNADDKATRPGKQEGPLKRKSPGIKQKSAWNAIYDLIDRISMNLVLIVGASFILLSLYAALLWTTAGTNRMQVFKAKDQMKRNITVLVVVGGLYLIQKAIIGTVIGSNF